MKPTLVVRGKRYTVLHERCVDPFATFEDTRGKKWIVGIEPWVEYDPQLLQEFRDAWSSLICRKEIKTWKVKNYVIRRIGQEYMCTCPARKRCCHINQIILQETGL